jgi:pyrroloquinoline-quinone synthase
VVVIFEQARYDGLSIYFRDSLKRTFAEINFWTGIMGLIDEIEKLIENKAIWHHPFMKLLYLGKLSPHQIKVWIINRYYFLKFVPVKDAIIMSKCTDPELRKLWLIRLARRVGIGGCLGDMQGWEMFAEAAGVSRHELKNSKIVFPGVKKAVKSYLDFVRSVNWLYAMSASIAEAMFLEELPKRLKSLIEMYEWIEPSGLEFFFQRLSYLNEEINMLSDAISKRVHTEEQLNNCLRAILFNCDFQWSMLDSIYKNIYNQHEKHLKYLSFKFL